MRAARVASARWRGRAALNLRPSRALPSTAGRQAVPRARSGQPSISPAWCQPAAVRRTPLRAARCRPCRPRVAIRVALARQPAQVHQRTSPAGSILAVVARHELARNLIQAERRRVRGDWRREALPRTRLAGRRARCAGRADPACGAGHGPVRRLLGDLELLPPLAGLLEQLVTRGAADAAQPLHPARRDLYQLAGGRYVELLFRGGQRAGRQSGSVQRSAG